MNETNGQENEIKVSAKFAERIKKRWDELAERQKKSGKFAARSDRRITEVSFIRDHHGKIAVQIGLRNGRSIRDNGREKTIEKFKEQNNPAYVRARVSEFIRKIRIYGYASVESEIPAELKEAVLKGMEKANISTSYKGAKAEATEKTAQYLLKSLDTPRTDGNVFALTAPVDTGSLPYTVKATPDMEKAMARGVSFILPPLHKDIRPEIVPLVEKTTAATLDTAAKTTENMAVSKIIYNRIASESVTAVTKDGRRIKGAANELASKDIAQQAYLRLLDTPRNKYTENDKRLESFMLATLKHKGVVAKDAMEIPADRINAAKEYISQNVAELPSRKASAFFPEELRQRYLAAKDKEKEIRAKQEPVNQEEKRKIKDALAATPTLLSEIIGGKKKSSDYSFNDVMQDLRNHPKSDDRMMMSRLLHLSVQNDPSLTKESKIPQECMQKNINLFKKYKIKSAKEPQLDFQKFLEREGLVSQRKNQEKQRIAGSIKKNMSASAEAGRVSGKLRQNIGRNEASAQTKTGRTDIAGEKQSLSPLQIALVKKRRNDFAR